LITLEVLWAKTLELLEGALAGRVTLMGSVAKAGRVTLAGSVAKAGRVTLAWSSQIFLDKATPWSLKSVILTIMS
jgi:hypothetical protein